MELALDGAPGPGIERAQSSNLAQTETLQAALAVKALGGQVNVVIHAIGIALSLPKILERGEVVNYVSLGAGNTGRQFDPETDRRVAENRG